MKIPFSALLLLYISHFALSQDSLITTLARKNVETFQPSGTGFTGIGWDRLVKESSLTHYVLIGEDHFTNEIPAFTSALAHATPFNNYYLELDPYSTRLLLDKMQQMDESGWKDFVLRYQTTFSFLAFAPEMALIRELVKSKTQVRGTEQIFLLADRLLCSELKKTTKNAVAKGIYEKIEAASAEHLRLFLQDQKNPFYFLTDDFDKNLKALQALPLSDLEKSILAELELSKKIYSSQDHHLRIQNMKKQLLETLPTLAGQRTLFKYGAVHMPKGESLLRIYDLGNLVNNIADSQMDQSLHIAVFGQNGAQGSPFDGFPPSPLDPVNGDLGYLQPFFKTVSGNAYHVYNLRPLQTEIEKGRLTVTNKWMLRTILGYDFLVIIPTVTPAKFNYR